MTMTTKSYAILGSALVLAGFVSGLGLGWKLYQPKPLPPSATAPRPEVRQADNSLVLERKEQPKAKPKMIIPRGDTLERTGEATVQPTEKPGELPRPPVVIDWSLVKEPDGGARVIASSPDGTVVSGEDVAVTKPQQAPGARNWAAGLEYAVNSWGVSRSVLAQRDLGPIRLGARLGVVTLTLPTGGIVHGGEAAVSLMIRF